MRFLFSTIFFCNILCAQNLVVNPGFEESYYSNDTVSRCTVLDLIHPHGWSSPTIGSPDFYFVPADYQNSIVPNDYRPAPYEGNAYAGIFCTSNYYEYVQGGFSEPLKAGQVYPVSFAITAESNKSFDPSRIGMCFSKEYKQFNKDVGSTQWLEDPVAVMDTVHCDTSDVRWRVYSFLYTASGGERTFIIGGFGITTDQPYMFIDDVAVGNKVVAPPPAPVADTIAADTPVIAAGKTLTLENIYFETNKSRILPESYQPLYDIIIEMKLQPDLKVEIIGHTDKHGDPKANQKLSEDRAKAVADFFIAHGIDASRITTSGEGSSKPVSEEDQKNRRVEFVFSK